MRLGVCYYPEHWPERMWADDARRMAALGLSFVRIGEFAWGRIEPARDRFDWNWLDRAVDTLAAAGLTVMMGTPTATPPRWLLAEHPDLVALDRDSRPRRFGSRRHYCFSSDRYRDEAARIAGIVAARYGRHASVREWQIDNEYGCHDTVVSYSDHAARAFRDWCRARYGDVARLNQAWGNVFWSMDYGSFADIDPPNLTVTEPNPSHVLDFRRFSSDQVMRFHRAQVDAVRAHAPGAAILHNTMGFFHDYDHRVLARDLDAIGWDSYPLGFLDSFDFPEHERRQWCHTSHPDIAAFHHDFLRGLGPIPFGVLEQQPGPVNWAAHNPDPLPGMVRLWTLEAFAHGSAFVSYFRWRQCPFAQEQMHAGLNRPDDTPDRGHDEVAAAARALATLPAAETGKAPVALVFDDESQWVFETQPQGAGFDGTRLAFRFYTALRALGLDVDIVGPDDALAGYALVVVPSLPIGTEARAASLLGCGGRLLLGPRTHSKTTALAIPSPLPPGPLAASLGLRVVRVSSHRPGVASAVTGTGRAAGRIAGNTGIWTEEIETASATTLAHDAGGAPTLIETASGHLYLAAWPDDALLASTVAFAAAEAGVPTTVLPEGLRLRRRGPLRFAFHYGPGEIDLPLDPATPLLLGTHRLKPGELAIWQQ